MPTSAQDFFALKETLTKTVSERVRFDRLLAKEVAQRLADRQLIFGMYSGQAVPINTARSLAIMRWSLQPDTRRSVAVINVNEIQSCLILDDHKVVDRLVRSAKKSYAKWVEEGGFHKVGCWQPPHRVHTLPLDYMDVVSKGDALFAISHLYSAAIKLSFKVPDKTDDYRELSVFEQLQVFTSHSTLLPTTRQQNQLLESLELPQPNSWTNFMKDGLCQ